MNEGGKRRKNEKKEFILLCDEVVPRSRTARTLHVPDNSDIWASRTNFVKNLKFVGTRTFLLFAQFQTNSRELTQLVRSGNLSEF